jgi:hypothetical protein
MSHRRKIVIALLAVVLLLVSVRVALPYLVEDLVNDRLAALDGYDGHVSDIDIHLWRGAYSIDGVEIVKTGASRPIPFFRTDRLNLSVEWRSLLHGSIVSEASFVRPQVNLVQGRTEADSQLGEGEDWKARLEELFPFRSTPSKSMKVRFAFWRREFTPKTPSRRVTSTAAFPISPTCWKAEKKLSRIFG